jgi:hypothetical protein
VSGKSSLARIWKVLIFRTSKKVLWLDKIASDCAGYTAA